MRAWLPILLVTVGLSASAGEIHYPVITCKIPTANMEVGIFLDYWDYINYLVQDSSQPFTTKKALVKIEKISNSKISLINEIHFIGNPAPFKARARGTFATAGPIFDLDVQATELSSSLKWSQSQYPDDPNAVIHEFPAECTKINPKSVNSRI
jgi:hypothetical protein